MRLFLIPVSTGRTLLYCKKIDAAAAGKQLGYIDRITNKASKTWAKWEEAEKGWKKALVTHGQRMLQKIPYEEWGLKSVPPLSTRREVEELMAHRQVELLYPKNVLHEGKVLGLLKKLATERQALHKKRMWWSILVAPLTAPIALIPIIPNIPFFYLVYRGWSHWRALSGSQHLEFLLNNKLVKPVSLPGLEVVYSHQAKPLKSCGKQGESIDEKLADKEGQEERHCDEKMLLQASDGKALAKLLDAPELVAEVERAVYQVEHLLEQKPKSQ